MATLVHSLTQKKKIASTRKKKEEQGLNPLMVINVICTFIK
jgi:hypothetical protein